MPARQLQPTLTDPLAWLHQPKLQPHEHPRPTIQELAHLPRHVPLVLAVDLVVTVCPSFPRLEHEEHLSDPKKPDEDCTVDQPEREHEPNLRDVKSDLSDVPRARELDELLVAVLVLCLLVPVVLLTLVGPTWAWPTLRLVEFL